MGAITNISLKILAIISLFFAPAAGQGYTQRFSVNDILSADSELNFLLKKNLRGMIEDPATKLVAFRFNSKVQEAKFIWIKDLEKVRADPFNSIHKKNKKYEFSIGSISGNASQIIWRILKDESLVQIGLLCSASSADQESNLVRMSALHDEKNLYLFVKRRGVFVGGKIMNPAKNSKTYLLMKKVDVFLSEN